MPQGELMRGLWIRCGIYAWVGCLACGLVLVAVGGWGSAILLLLGVWAFCRATHLIVQLSEHSTNRQSFSAHLLSLIRRIVVGRELGAVYKSSSYGCDLEHSDGTPVGAVNQSMYVFTWSYIANLSVLLLTLTSAGLCLRRDPVCSEAESASLISGDG